MNMNAVSAPLISVIIPVCNAAGNIRACIQSLACQTFKDFEVLFMDGASTDDTVEIIKSCIPETGKFIVSSSTDLGIYDAMNKGIKKSTGRWLYFFGSDDQLAGSNVLSGVAKHLGEDDEIVYGDIILSPGGQQEKGEWNNKRMLHMCINHQRIFYKAKLFHKYGVFDLRYPVNADYGLNISLFSNPLVRKKHITLPIAFYNSGGFSFNKVDENFWDDFQQVIAKKFSPYLSRKEIYGRLAFYCWYHLNKKNYYTAFRLFCRIYLHTLSFGFLKHSLSQFRKSFGNHV